MTAEVLVVDDDKSIRQLLAHRLENEGYDVRTVESGQAAARALDDGHDPDLLITDIMMPRLDGTQLLRKVRNGDLAVPADLPVVVLSSRGREADFESGFEYGADDYVTKPFQGGNLLARVRKYVGT